MVFGKLMSIFDMYAILVMLLAPIFPLKWVLYGAGWLVLKGGIFAFQGNIVSMIDVFFGIYIVFVAFGISSTILTIIAIIYLGQKAAFAFVS